MQFHEISFDHSELEEHLLPDFSVIWHESCDDGFCECNNGHRTRSESEKGKDLQTFTEDDDASVFFDHELHQPATPESSNRLTIVDNRDPDFEALRLNFLCLGAKTIERT